MHPIGEQLPGGGLGRLGIQWCCGADDGAGSRGGTARSTGNVGDGQPLLPGQRGPGGQSGAGPRGQEVTLPRGPFNPPGDPVGVGQGDDQSRFRSGAGPRREGSGSRGNLGWPGAGQDGFKPGGFAFPGPAGRL